MSHSFFACRKAVVWFLHWTGLCSRQSHYNIAQRTRQCVMQCRIAMGSATHCKSTFPWMNKLYLFKNVIWNQHFQSIKQSADSNLMGGCFSLHGWHWHNCQGQLKQGSWPQHCNTATVNSKVIFPSLLLWFLLFLMLCKGQVQISFSNIGKRSDPLTGICHLGY